MAIQWTSNPEIYYPSGEDSIEITPSGVAWDPSDWVTLGTPDAASYLTKILFRTADTGLMDFEIEIGVGATPASALATMHSTTWSIGSICDMGMVFRLPKALSGLTSGQPIKARISTSGSSTTPWKVSVGTLKTPIVGEIVTTANPLKCLPSGDDSTIIVSGDINDPAWTQGDYEEIVASLAEDIEIVAISIFNFNSKPFQNYDLGVGAEDSETIITTLPRGSGYAQCGVVPVTLSNPLEVDMGERIAARIRNNATFPYGSNSYRTAIMYHAR